MLTLCTPSPQASPILSFFLTHQPRRGLRNSQSLWWRNQPNLHWTELLRLPPSQRPLTVLPSRGLRSPPSPHPHHLQGRPTQARAQAWPPHALVRWSTSTGRSLSHLRSVCSLQPYWTSWYIKSFRYPMLSQMCFVLGFFLLGVEKEGQYHLYICMLE